MRVSSLFSIKQRESIWVVKKKLELLTSNNGSYIEDTEILKSNSKMFPKQKMDFVKSLKEARSYIHLLRIIKK